MTSGLATADRTPRTKCTGCGEGRRNDPSCDCLAKQAPGGTFECLERPLFTCGMVLSDSDLTALVDWTRARLALRRYVDGWGVVCGFDVRCDPARPGSVLVQPGYAVTCRGDDIVACAPIPVDLTACCTDDDPCGEPSTAKGADPCGDYVVDLVLEAEEAPAATELLDTCGCGGTCSDRLVVPTRLREGAGVRPYRVPFPDADPTVKAAEAWQAAYEACHAVVAEYVAGDVKPSDTSQLLTWLKGQRLDPPCDWWQSTCESLLRAEKATRAESASKGAGKAEVTDYVDAALARAFLELVVDCRHRLLRRACEQCPPKDPLRLARVWLRRPNADRKEKSCVVVRVDAYAPYRRDLAPFARAMPAGSTDLAPFIWQRWEQVCGRWRDLTHDDRTRTMAVPESTSELFELLEHTTWVSWTCQEEPPLPVVVKTDCLGDRVLGFTRRSLDETKRVPREAATATDGSSTATPTTTPTTQQPTANPVSQPIPALTTQPPAAPPTPPPPPPPPVAATAPQSPTVGRTQTRLPDEDLSVVQGIGKARSTRLKGAGITTLDTLAAASLDRLDEILGPGVNVSAIRGDAKRLAARPG